MNTKLFVATATLLINSAFGTTPVQAAENPLDQVGIQHNMYLGCLMDAKASRDEALAVLVEKCGYNPGMPLERFIATHQPMIDAIDPLRPMTENLVELRQQLSDYEFSFIVRMDQIVQNTESLDAAAVQFEELEREGIARLDPKSKNGALVLSALSVVRHSARYWSKFSAGTTSKPDPKKGWAIVSVCDAMGALFFGSSEMAASASYSAYQELASQGYFPLYAN
ncbi:hypothetical protein [Xanthomonas indica]|uniref:Secreted protein n=1 Tax=Xanthomonas indica TaxID=2912242 RepID=A0AAU8I8W5_9XANT|nr:hypothetical protein [Xanthomonas indica]MCI2262930.1 hypothetical protein [Xanthomonas indica]